MNEILEKMIEELPSSPTDLNENNLKKIYTYIPVPSEHKILWADISSFGAHPAGVVLTDRALVVKATEDEVKNNTKIINKENKKKDKDQQVDPPKVIYRIIPWEYYSPEDYELVVEDDDKDRKRYVIKAGKTELAQFKDDGLYAMFMAYREKMDEQKEAIAATFSAFNTVNAETIMFNATYGADQSKSGHGIYAEEAGALLDRAAGESSSVVGRDNAKNGPDKIVNGSPIQCKYYNQANGTVNACFNIDPNTGIKVFRYYDLNGEPMKIEVPADQYTDAIEVMKQKIADGQVPGVNDPQDAYKIIRKGRLTYNQAFNLAKAGTIESITYDAATTAINCLSVFGISAIVTFTQVYWVTKDFKKATKSALITGVHVYGMAFAGGIIASQIARTNFANALNPFIDEIGEILPNQMVHGLVNSMRALAGKEAIYGAAAQNSFKKFLNATAFTKIMMFTVASVPDTVHVFNKKISENQYLKNMTSRTFSCVGGTIGTVCAGKMIADIGVGKIDKKTGAFIAVGAGSLGSIAGHKIGDKVGDLICEDDKVITSRMFNAVMLNAAIDYMLMTDELEELVDMVYKDSKRLRELLTTLRISKTQEKDIREYLETKIQLIVLNRDKVDENEEERLDEEIKYMLEKGDFGYDM